MVSRLVSVTNKRFSGRGEACFAPTFVCRRIARILICRSDSSPDTYSTFWESAISIAICSINVDLPIPGSPPTSTTEPGTIPPPSTRANSPIGRGMRSSASPPTCPMGRGSERPVRPRTVDFLAGTFSSWMTSSTSELNSPHCGHLPI